MSIDINKPVKEGFDKVLNKTDGTQELASGEDYAKAAAAGELAGLAVDPKVTNHNEPLPVVDEPQRSSESKTAKVRVRNTTQKEDKMVEEKTPETDEVKTDEVDETKTGDEQTEVNQTEIEGNDEPASK